MVAGLLPERSHGEACIAASKWLQSAPVSVEDKLINVAVRRILASLWVDITLVQVRTTSGVVYVSGLLKRMTASHQEISDTVLREMDIRLRKISGVRDVKYQLLNWERKLTALWEKRDPYVAPVNAPIPDASPSSS
jgi:hypothetical protein